MVDRRKLHFRMIRIAPDQFIRSSNVSSHLDGVHDSKHAARRDVLTEVTLQCVTFYIRCVGMDVKDKECSGVHTRRRA